jgi:hypothetical protein
MSRKVWGLPVLLLLLVTGMLLAGCGGSSDDDESSTKLEGSLVDAPIVGGVINVFDSNGKLVASSESGLGGAYTKSFKGGKAPFLVQFTNDDGAAFLDLNGDGVKSADDPFWNVPAFYTYVVNKGGAQAASGSVASTFAANLAIALHGGVIGQTKANVEKARNMVQGLFTFILSENAMEVSESFDVLGTAAAATEDADETGIVDSLAMRIIQRSLVKMAQGATNNAILPADIDDALNSGQALINAVNLLAADLADSVLDGVALPGAMDDLGIPDEFRAAFAAAAPTSGDYATWGTLDETDVLVTFLQMSTETPASFKAGGFDSMLQVAGDNAEEALFIPALAHPPAKMRVNTFPNRVLQNAQDQIEIEVVLLDGCDTPISEIDQTVNLAYDTTGTGAFVGDDEFTFAYDVSAADTANSGTKVDLDVTLRANAKLTDTNEVRVFADTAANRAKPADYAFSFAPCAIETGAFDNCTTLSLVFAIEDLAGGLLDNQMITLTLDDHAVFADGKTTQTIKVSSLIPAEIEICPFDNLLADCSVLFDSALASDARVKFSNPIMVVDEAGKPWFADIEVNSPDELNASGNTTVDLSISLFDACGEPFSGSATVTLSVTRGTIVPGTLSATSVDSKTLSVPVSGGVASGTVIYTAPGADSIGFDTFNLTTGISGDYISLPFLPIE